MDNNELNMANYLMDEDEDSGIVQIFYSDLDLKTRKEILTSIETANEMIDINDEIVVSKIEQDLAAKPIFTISGKELLNIMNIDI
jgi:hypothetical protein